MDRMEDIERIVNKIPKLITEDHNKNLNNPITMEEVA